MHLFRPLSWISSSRGNSPAPSAEADGSPMTATLSNVANHFNSHATAHNERVYGGTKRKVADNGQKRNKEITDFFSSSPMGAQQSKKGEVRGEKKRKLTHSSSSQEKENGPSAQRTEVNSKGTPVNMRGKAELLARLSDSDSAESNEDAISQTTSRLNSFESRTTISPPALLTSPTHDSSKAKASKNNRSSANIDPVMTPEEREKERKRQIVLSRMRNGQTPPWTSPFYQMDASTETRLISDLRESFRHQINLEVKLQHEKLQEIRAEMAKSQIALEQLRRCHLIPFPQTYADPEDMLNIMEGAGPAIPQANGAMPQWATPFGVTEGAYTRHYAKWLIPDPRFDGVAHQQPQAQQSGYPFPNMGEVRMDGRQTRNSFQLDPVPTNKRRGRGDVSAPLQALSSGYAQKKEDAGPSVLKRGDGRWVKLVCLDCHRENFGSTQGFINHCRIAHKREFKSHEEAAVNSGQLVEVDQFGGLVGEEKLPASVVYSCEGLVHHKIREAPLDWTGAKGVLKHVNDALRQFREGSLCGIDHIPGQKTDTLKSSTPAATSAKPKPNKDFVPSASTPHLSALLMKQGFNKSLSSSVAAAKAPVIETPYTASDAEDDEEVIVVEDIARKNRVNPPSRPAFRPPILPNMRPNSSSSNGNHAPILPPVSKSKKSQSAVKLNPQMAKAREVQAKINAKKPSTPTPAPTISQEDGAGNATDTTLIVEEDSDVEMLLGDDLSPAIHSEGDKAPSLVSDDDDYTAESEGESDGENDDTEAAESDEDIHVREESDGTRSRKRTQSRDELESTVVTQRSAKRSKKGVSFVSPVKDIKKAKGRR